LLDKRFNIFGIMTFFFFEISFFFLRFFNTTSYTSTLVCFKNCFEVWWKIVSLLSVFHLFFCILSLSHQQYKEISYQRKVTKSLFSKFLMCVYSLYFFTQLLTTLVNKPKTRLLLTRSYIRLVLTLNRNGKHKTHC
jgi:hypothetical protein